MTKICPSCDVLAPPDARYCRHCGAQLQSAPGGEGGDSVSPIATTAPLSGQNPTDEFVARPASSSPPPQSAVSHTSEITRAEMNDLLRRDARDNGYGSTHARPAAALPHIDSSHDFSPGDFDSEQTQIAIPVKPHTSRHLPADATAARVATRANGKPQFDGSPPRQVTLSPSGSLQGAARETAAPFAPPAAQPDERRAFRVWLGMGVGVLLIVIIGGVAVAAFWFGARGFLRRDSQSPAPPPVAVAGGETAPGPASGPEEMANAKLGEADALIASGNAAEALARLREAAVLDPANAETHRRLASLLLARGARRAAVEELRVVTRLVPADAEAWRALASAQFTEGLYEDAVESYRGLGEASPEALARDSVQLAYAEALRLSGRNQEARAIYRRLVSSPEAEVAAASKRQLGQPAPPSPADEDDAASRRAAEAARFEDASRTPQAPSVSPVVTAQPINARVEVAPAGAPRAAGDSSPSTRVSPASPAEHYQRGVGLWATNRAAAVAEFRAADARGNADASYYLGLSLAEGRDPRALKRADLVAALVHFGRARRGKFRASSAAYEEQLGRELDRRRNP